MQEKTFFYKTPQNLHLSIDVEAAALFLSDSIMKLVLASLLAVASATELNEANFETEVFASGKNSFIKFLAPW